MVWENCSSEQTWYKGGVLQLLERFGHGVTGDEGARMWCQVGVR